MGLDAEFRIKELALLRVFPDLILEKWLFAGEDHADQAAIQRLLEGVDDLLRVGVGKRRTRGRGVLCLTAYIHSNTMYMWGPD